MRGRLSLGADSLARLARKSKPFDRDPLLWRQFRSPMRRADTAINAKELLEHARPTVQFLGCLRRISAHDRQFLRAKFLDRVGQRFRRVFARPQFLFVKNDSIHVTAANAGYRRAAGLTFERN